MFAKALVVITNRKLVARGNIFDAVQRAASAGADAVILREKDLSDQALLQMAKDLKKITDECRIPLIINGNVKVAREAGAYGYHTGYKGYFAGSLDLPLKLGISVHSLDEAVSAEKIGADYIIAGHVFETGCKPGLKGKGPEFIQDICAAVTIPVIAVGGININNAYTVMQSGVGGVAVMSLAMADTDGTAVKTLKRKIASYS